MFIFYYEFFFFFRKTNKNKRNYTFETWKEAKNITYKRLINEERKKQEQKLLEEDNINKQVIGYFKLNF